MTTKHLTLLFLVGVCGLWACSRSKSVETTSTGTQPVVDSPLYQLPAEDPKPAQVPGAASGAAAKHQTTSVNSSKVKTNGVAAVQPEPITHTEPKAAPKEETTETKPSEMKVANGFDKNPYLASTVKPLLPPRTSVTNAAAGFKKERDFIAALHLSKNLVIPFDDIKTRVTGHHRMSLNDAIRDIRPSISKNMAKEEVNKAERQAKDDESRAKDEAKKAAAQERLAKNGK
jgi:hypothetical protein